LKLADDSYPAGYKFLAEILFRNGEYGEALYNIDHFAKFKKTLNPAEQLLLESCQFSAEAVTHPVPFMPVNPGDSINTAADEYWPSLNAEANKLVFTRLELKDANGLKIGNPQEDFYFSTLNSRGWSKAQPLGPPVNTEENEGAQTISADGRLLIFTGCGRPDGVGSCDLYISVNHHGNWSMPVNMGEPVNSGAWESQPSLSADGKILYFVSSRAGGKGKMDIWRAEKIGVSTEGVPQFGNVVNVSELNTAGNDLSPFIHADGKTFYFASDGRPGLGGTDLFVSRMQNGRFSNPENLGYPINSNRNEEGMVVEIGGSRAWYTSDRNPGMGRDIYAFSLPEGLMPEQVSYLKGTILDAQSGHPVGANILLSNLESKKEVTSITASENEGEFLVCLPSGINYGLNITQKGYLFSSENFPLKHRFAKTSPKEINIKLQHIAAGAITTLRNIFFETNSYQLKAESQTQLDEMAKFMVVNPGVIMEVVGHTDKMGSEAYNLELSGKRAATVVAELLKRQVAPYRLKSRGAGFSIPIGDNNTEEGRSANRRTEFIILEVTNDK
jgi:outer membrane protein OmpA-like peptidoglycan-associated protein